jgi:hypothetical protein
MPARAKTAGHIPTVSKERISDMKRSVEELSQIARAEGADFLAYLLEMASAEAGDILSGKSVLGSSHVDRDKPRRMPM